MSKELPNHAGLCDQCKREADEITQGNAFLQARIALFVQRHLHRSTHYEIHRYWMIRRGYWQFLPAFLNEVSES